MFCKIRVCKIDADPDDADLLCFSQKSLRGSASFDRSIISQNINLAKYAAQKSRHTRASSRMDGSRTRRTSRGGRGCLGCTRSYILPPPEPAVKKKRRQGSPEHFAHKPQKAERNAPDGAPADKKSSCRERTPSSRPSEPQPSRPAAASPAHPPWHKSSSRPRCCDSAASAPASDLRCGGTLPRQRPSACCAASN